MFVHERAGLVGQLPRVRLALLDVLVELREVLLDGGNPISQLKRGRRAGKDADTGERQVVSQLPRGGTLADEQGEVP